MTAKTVVATMIATVLVIMGYALVNDLLDGLPFSRSAPSWGAWAAGLFVFGLAGILIEGAFEWVFEPDDPWRRGPRRIVRVCTAALVVTTLAAAAVLLNRYLR